MVKKISSEKSFEGFNFLEFLKGNRKFAIAGIGYLIGLLISDAETTAFLSAGLFSAGYTALEFYMKKVKLKQK